MPLAMLSLLGYGCGRQCVAQRALEYDPKADADFYEGKLAACTFFYRYHLPQAREKLRYVGSIDRTALDAKATWFTGV